MEHQCILLLQSAVVGALLALSTLLVSDQISHELPLIAILCPTCTEAVTPMPKHFMAAIAVTTLSAGQALQESAEPSLPQPHAPQPSQINQVFNATHIRLHQLSNCTRLASVYS